MFYPILSFNNLIDIHLEIEKLIKNDILYADPDKTKIQINKESAFYSEFANDKNEIEISDKVDSLRRFPNFHLIEIKGFDEFLAELYSEITNNSKPPFLQDPYTESKIRLEKIRQL